MSENVNVSMDELKAKMAALQARADKLEAAARQEQNSRRISFVVRKLSTKRGISFLATAELYQGIVDGKRAYDRLFQAWGSSAQEAKQKLMAELGLRINAAREFDFSVPRDAAQAAAQPAPAGDSGEPEITL